MYLICELSNEMIYIELTFQPDPETLLYKIRQIVSTLPNHVPIHNTYGAGEVIVSEDQRFVYGTNRQTDLQQPKLENSMVIFERDQEDGRLRSNPRFLPLSISGFSPRQFAFSLETDQRWMVVVGQQDDQIAIYQRDSNLGGLKFIDHLKVEKPTVAQFLPAPLSKNVS